MGMGKSTATRSVKTTSDAQRCGSLNSDTDLLEQVQAGSELAFDQLYLKYAKAVAWVARSFVPEPDTDEAIQRSFLLLWVKARKIDLAGESLLPWLLATCRFECLKIRARERKHDHTDLDELQVPSTLAGAEEQAIRNHMLGAVEAVVAKLSQTDQKIFYLCLIQGLKYEQAAHELGISHGSIRNRLSRLKKVIRSRTSELETGRTT